jgi:hypothetical protein
MHFSSFSNPEKTLTASMVKFILSYISYIGYRCHMGRKNRVGESPEHFAYKKIAIDILRDKGFKETEIKEEYDVEYPIDGRIKYTVDVVGIKDNYKVAIECGKVELSKLLNLRKIFDEVLVINPQKIVEMYEYWKTKYFTETDELRRENKRLLERAEWVCNDANMRIEQLEEAKKKLEDEVKALQIKLRRYEKVLAQAWNVVKEPF